MKEEEQEQEVGSEGMAGDHLEGARMRRFLKTVELPGGNQVCPLGWHLIVVMLSRRRENLSVKRT